MSSCLKPRGVRVTQRRTSDKPPSSELLKEAILFGHQSLKPVIDLQKKMKNALRDKASPRHVPALIIDVPDIPYTFSSKKVESAITNIVNGRPVTNRDALVNPESLDYFEKILPQVQK